jgi:hypothetical protein
VSDHPSRRNSLNCNHPALGSEPHHAAISPLALSGLLGLPPRSPLRTRRCWQTDSAS